MSEPSPPLPGDVVHREGLSRPETLLERLGYATEALLKRLGLALVVLVAVLVLVIGVPLARVARSDELAWARDFLERRGEVVEAAVGPLEAVGLPRRYRLEPGHARLVLPVRGTLGEGEVELELTEEKPWPDGRRSFRLVEGKVTDPRGRSYPLRPRRR